MRRFLRGALLSTLPLIFGLSAGYILVQKAWSLAKDPYQDFDIFTEVFFLIENHHVQQSEPDELIHAAIDGMVKQLDEHSHYIPPQQYAVIKKESQGWSVGIGIELNKDRTILRVLNGSPAAIAGIMVGDQITHLDNQDLQNQNLYQIQQLLQGERGSAIQVRFLRNGSEQTLKVIRDNILVTPVNILDLKNDLYYVQLEKFSKGSIRELKTQLFALAKPHEIRGIILDLRDNPGGFVEEGIQLADLFLEEGLIVEVVERDNKITQKYSAQKDPDDITRAKLIILINQNSASASELSAGALHIQNRATLLGTESYGKGSMQKVYEFKNGAALKLTVAHYQLKDELQISPEDPLKPDMEVQGYIENPKQEIIDVIQDLKIETKTKRLLMQRLSLLQTTTSASAIPRNADFQTRLQHDPQLKAAWIRLKKED
ncbi:MAG: S41 family peptidase [Myxococcota bacterium]|nr:S41 family peptidase [Myxococcota bacterium]